MTHARQLRTADVVTVTTGIVLSDRLLDGVYEVCNHVLQDDLFTHQLPAACGVAAPHLITQHPWLDGLTPPQGDEAAALAWAAQIEREHGEYLTVTPMQDPAWQRGNALTDAAAQFGADRVVGVVIPEAGERP